MTDLSQTANAHELIERRVRVDRARTPQEALTATGRRQYVADPVVASMPRGESDEVIVSFFKVGRRISDAELEREYQSRGLVPVDPYTLAALHELRNEPGFADVRPNATHWEDGAGRWCYAAFDRLSAGWDVDVSRRDRDWNDRWWIAGRRK